MVINSINKSGGVLVQRGITTSAGIVKIKEVDMDKSIVLSVSKGSAGYVAARGKIELTMSQIFNGKYNYLDLSSSNGVGTSTYNYNNITGSISDGSTDLTVKEYSARLISPTELECDGPVEWQVIEFK